MKIFVTGANGFLGTHLCRALRAQGHDVVSPSSKEADLRSPDSLSAFNSTKFDQIFHLAAWTQAGDFCLSHPGEQWLVNQQLNTTVLNWWAGSQKDAKLIAIGSSCCYEPGLPHVEQNFLKGLPIESLFTYAMTKRMLYTGLQALNKQYDMRYLYVVPSTLYGPDYHLDGRQMHFIFDLMRKVVAGKHQGEPVVLWGDGLQRRELIHVRDFVRVMIMLSNSLDNDIVNVGAGSEHSIKRFAEILCGLIGYDKKLIQYDTTKYVGAKSKVLDITKLRRLLPDFRHSELESGLRETLTWYLNAAGIQPGQAAQQVASKSGDTRSQVNRLLDDAIAEVQRDNAKDALQLIIQAKALDLRVSDLSYVAAICLIKLGDLTAGRSALEEELRYYPDNGPAKALLEDVKRDLSHSPAGANGTHPVAVASTASTPGENALARTVTRVDFKPVAIDQFVTSFSFGDGVGNCIRLVRRVLKEWGFQSNIFAEGADPRLAGEWHWFQQQRSISSPRNIVFYHPSDGRSPIIPYLREIPDRKYLYYHNITPSEYFMPYDRETALICQTAREAVSALRPIFKGSICDSQYNADDLKQLGFGPSTVLPIPFFRDEFLTQAGDAEVLERYGDGLTNILFVGRLAPNKCQHDAVRAFDYYQKNINPRSRLILAGLATGSEAYTTHIRQIIDELKTENVVITGHITFAQLIAYYQTAQAFLCLSEHEGFCIPLLEAMHFRVPIVAFDGSAVTETLGGCSVMLKNKDPKTIAESLDHAITDRPFNLALIESQQKQLERYSETQFRDRLAGMLSQALL